VGAASQQYPNITPVQVTAGDLPRRRCKNAGGFRRLADRAADQWRRQHALHVVDELATGQLTLTVYFIARHQSRYRAGASAEPRQSRDAATALCSDAARHVGTEESSSIMMLIAVFARATATARTMSPITPTCTCWTR
jgi:hypothetical protein